jgi:hypothetical protein
MVMIFSGRIQSDVCDQRIVTGWMIKSCLGGFEILQWWSFGESCGFSVGVGKLTMEQLHQFLSFRQVSLKWLCSKISSVFGVFGNRFAEQLCIYGCSLGKWKEGKFLLTRLTSF